MTHDRTRIQGNFRRLNLRVSPEPARSSELESKLLPLPLLRGAAPRNVQFLNTLLLLILFSAKHSLAAPTGSHWHGASGTQVPDLARPSLRARGNLKFTSSKIKFRQSTFIRQLFGQSVSLPRRWTRVSCSAYQPYVQCDSKGNIVSISSSGSSSSSSSSRRWRKRRWTRGRRAGRGASRRASGASPSFCSRGNNSVPSSIKYVTQLQSLSLPSCNYAGALPTELALLPSLVHLDLSYNQLTGALPAMANLTYLDVRQNKLTKSLPDMPLLQFLLISHNRFTGPLPVVPSAQIIDGESNFLSGLLDESVGDMSELTYLNLKNNVFAGSLPSAIGSLTALLFLDLSFNNFRSKLPVTMTGLLSLTYMNVSFNVFDGPVSNAIADLSTLQMLDLSYNMFSKAIPSLSTLSSLSYLDVSYNSLSGVFPTLSALSSLWYLNASRNSFTGQLPMTLATEALVFLDLSYNSLTGSLPSLTAFTKLTYMDVSSNKLTQQLPSLSGLLSLRFMNLSSNKISSSLAFSAPGLTELIALDLAYNSFYGSLTSLSLLTSLNYLRLRSNQFADLLPNEIGNLGMLQVLDLSYNSFIGQLPSRMSEMSSLNVMQLSHNLFASVLPYNLPSALVEIDVTNNMLAGPLPETLPRSTQVFKIASNVLTGPLPTSIASMPSLVVVDMSNNYFTSSLPSFHPQAPVDTALLHSNYFSKGISNIQDSGLCSDRAVLSLAQNCLPSTPAVSSDSISSNSSSSRRSGALASDSACELQQQRIASICDVTCAPCPDTCFIVGSSAVPTCPCPSSSYVVLDAGVARCENLGSQPLSFCLSPDNIFLQPLLLQGSATVAQNLSFSNLESMTGLALLPSPIKLFVESTCETVTLSTSFSFTMDPQTTSTGGFTFAILQSSSGPDSYQTGGLGLQDSGNGVAVEFDVREDEWDPDGNHVGLNIGGSVVSVATAGLDFSLLDPEPTFVWITYEAGTKLLAVYVSKQNTKPSEPTLLYYFSLCVTLRPQPLHSDSAFYYAGFTAEGTMRPAITNWCLSTSFKSLFYRAQAISSTGSTDASDSFTMFGGTTSVPALVRLSSGIQSDTSACFLINTLPLFSASGGSFSANFTVLINWPFETPADGFAFVIASKAGVGSIGSPMGLSNSALGNNIAVEFDIYRNSNTNDPNNNHIGLDINSNAAASIAWGTPPFMMASEVPFTVWVDYNGLASSLNVYMAQNSSKKPANPTLAVSYPIIPVLQPGSPSTGYYMGFTSSAGVSSAQYDVQSWCYTVGYPPVSKCLTASDATSSMRCFGRGQSPSISLSLTPHAVATTGAAFTPIPLPTDSAGPTCASLGFTASFSFFLTSAFRQPDFGSLLTHGFTFALLTSPAVGEAGAQLGYGGIGPHSLAVEFDTYQDTWDPDDNHIGINLGGSVESVVTSSARTDIRGDYSNMKHAAIQYDPSTQLLSVYMYTDSMSGFNPLTYYVDLCTLLNTGMTTATPALYVGFTAGNDDTARGQYYIYDFKVTTVMLQPFVRTAQDTLKTFVPIDAPTSLQTKGIAAAAPALIRLGYSAIVDSAAAYLKDPLPLYSTNSGSFSTNFTVTMFQSYGQAEGMAFVMASASVLGFTGSAFGVPILYVARAVVVEFDVFQDVGLGDPNNNHVGICIQRPDFQLYHQAIGTPNFQMSAGNPIYVWVDYDSPSTQISVYVTAAGPTKPGTALVTTYMNIYDVLQLPSSSSPVHLGFSMATGGQSAFFSVNSWCLPSAYPLGCLSARDAVTNIKRFGTAVSPSLTVNLTPNNVKGAGAALMKLSYPTDSPSCSSFGFSSSFSFYLIMGNSKNGQGFTFAVLLNSTLGSGGSQLGYGGTGPGFAVEFDAYTDFWDPPYMHVGLNIGGSVVSVTTQPAAFLYYSGLKYAWVDLDAVSSTLFLFLSLDNTKPALAVFSVTIDVCSALQLPTNSTLPQIYAGFTSSGDDSAFGSQAVFDWSITTVVQRNGVIGNTTDGPSTGLLLDPDALAVTGSNRFFRYSSSGYSGSPNGYDSWLINSYFSWNSAKYLNPVWDQGTCGSCWAIAVTDAVAAAHAILHPTARAPFLDYTQILARASSNPYDPCGGGNPGNAFRLLSDPTFAGGGLKSNDSTVYPVVSFEKATYFDGWFGLLIAVQQQPVVVQIQADAYSFVNYPGGYVYRDPTCYTYSLNHAVLVVGYLIAGVDPDARGLAPPFWIVRNSWGASWGDKGYMRMAIQGGDGICGINVLAPLYPVVMSTPSVPSVDPCRGSSWNGVMNPCGKFTCHTDPSNSNTNTCDCQLPFTMVTNTDGSRTCAHGDVCATSYVNPCNVGTCRNIGGALFTCICPPGFYNGNTVDGWPTCARTNDQAPTSLTVGSSTLMCSDVFPVYGLTLDEFQSVNPSVDCSASIPLGTTLDVSPPADYDQCAVFYTTGKNERCRDIQQKFSISDDLFSILNPGIECSAAIPTTTMICLEHGTDKSYDCQLVHQVQANETCEDLLNLAVTVDSNGVSRPLSLLDLYRYNPGLRCDTLSSSTLVAAPIQVCLKVSASSSSTGGCGSKCKPLTKIDKTTTCASLQSSWKKCNKYKCADSLSSSNAKVCIPL